MKELTGETASELEQQIKAMMDREIAKANGCEDAVAILDRCILDIGSRQHDLPARRPKRWLWIWLKD